MNQTVLVKLKKLFKYFLIGVLGVIPIVLVLQVFIIVKQLIGGLFFLVYGYVDSYSNTLFVFVISFLLLATIGYTLSKYRNSLVIGTVEKAVNKIPILGMFYRIIKKIIAIFTAQGREDNREIVYIEYPKDGLWVPGYVTNRHGEMVVVYVPTSPNPTSGFTVIVHQSKLVYSLMDLEKVTSFIASVGFDYPDIDHELYQLSQHKSLD
ncbi:MAG: DUF502 domain-containing protein [Gammaproteobacteria bacterium]|nr:DUF502 domain-containing protein [Gammaproteobacteria bacterium]